MQQTQVRIANSGTVVVPSIRCLMKIGSLQYLFITVFISINIWRLALELAQIRNFMNIRLAVIDFVHTDGLTHDEVNRCLVGHVCFECVEMNFRRIVRDVRTG
jgi:hypothetical protein